MQAAAILVILFAGGLPTAVSAQDIMAKGFSAIDSRRLVEQNAQPKQLLTATSPTFHQTVGGRMQRQRPPSTYSRAQRVAAAVVMGFAGFWVGGKLGATIRGGHCCDDGPYVGFIYGAPIGAAAGVTLGIVLTR
jgi:hypothetical protein